MQFSALGFWICLVGLEEVWLENQRMSHLLQRGVCLFTSFVEDEA